MEKILEEKKRTVGQLRNCRMKSSNWKLMTGSHQKKGKTSKNFSLKGKTKENKENGLKL